ncbi:MAG TPA: serine/threonine-protein kinase, partial [Vicinamibacteria bacterium]|nr:serine/threonine-protein kinase [Vicinamibacteria bacterium]
MSASFPRPGRSRPGSRKERHSGEAVFSREAIGFRSGPDRRRRHESASDSGPRALGGLGTPVRGLGGRVYSHHRRGALPLAAGDRVGPYEIVGPLGAGGMGEVYRARDQRLERDVAVKLLPDELTENKDRLRRFEEEAKAAGTLNHPNLLTVHDVGTKDGVPYLVSELLEGSTLRALLGGGNPLPLRKAIDYAAQIARGLAAAHDKGIVHRDLKPENLFVTEDGRAKILDFGLAKRNLPPQDLNLEAATGTLPTTPGTVLGTVGYMSPEQVQGLPADPRSDIFSFGAVLYEMLTGRRAFRRDTRAETEAAILRDDPPELSDLSRPVPPGLERITRRCLEKSPAERFRSAHDLAFALEALSGSQASRVGVAAKPPPRWRGPVVGVVLVLAALAAGVLVAPRVFVQPAPSFRPLTFRNGLVSQARFTPDGSAVVF